MQNLKIIRERLGLSQEAMGSVMGCVQGNITAYERALNPRPIPAPRASKVIEYAASKGLHIGFDHIYGTAPLPEIAVAVEV
ncbi:helix-turn-helix transcriptional regulator [Comamonas thiooxydans]|uniref:helix-turn-helix domain-containing protein n=1 Tax=Comamonas thiooxydans TaxID=363952 RepID=UPI00244D30A4|nr:helix-turn-helix transcriptional regulator [Comamonas thiooxydans]MDH1251039.1 helix-turn-helix transcriptional regulator [Comamonas thiooxydans]